MIRLYHAPRTRSIRVLWLLEELGLPYELERIEFLPTSDRFFQQKTPTGKVPTLEDGEVVMCESGAITEYLLERYGDGRLAPPAGSPARAAYLQWLHFAECTAFPPIGVVVWLSRYRDDAEGNATLLEAARARCATGFEYLEREIGEKTWLLGDDFSAADVMMGFTLFAARFVGVLGDSYPRLETYLDRLGERPAFRKAMAA